MGRGKTKTQLLLDEAKQFFSRYDNDETRRTYVSGYRRFVQYCRQHHNCTTTAQCKAHVQDYADHLVQKGLTASTIHTYLASVCLYLNVPLADMQKPTRHTSEYTRGRSFNQRTERKDNDIKNQKYAKTVQLQSVLGLRRRELMRLKKEDLCIDESGNPCVRIRGKGGKWQLQRILPEDVAFVSEIFNQAKEGEKLFTEKDFRNKISYHTLRAEQAKRAYTYYEKQVATLGGRAELEAQIRARWTKYNLRKETKQPKFFDEKSIRGTYFLRGKNKQFAISHNLPWKYDRLALMAVSVFHLSHWRVDVTVASYLTAI